MTRPAARQPAARYRLVAFDMDDTLYPEIEYVASGFDSVARYVADMTGMAADVLRERLGWHFAHGDRRRVFDAVLAESGLGGRVAVADLVALYRNHVPAIRLRAEAPAVLSALREAGAVLAVVTDGPLLQQQRKAHALFLERHVDRIVFTDALGPGCAKPSPAAFESLMQEFDVPAAQCLYAADNPRKDFLGPRRLGWFTLQFVHEAGIYGREAAPPDGAPHGCIRDLREVLRYVLPA